VIYDGSILSCCPRNPHGHERALKEEEEVVNEVNYFNSRMVVNEAKVLG